MRLDEWVWAAVGPAPLSAGSCSAATYTRACTFIAAPALVYATGAAGFYALSYTIMVFPIVFIFAPRLWSVARARGYVRVTGSSSRPATGK